MYDFEPKNFPTSPGVYLMKGGKGKILYVGKAKNLRARLGSYFRGETGHTVKTAALVGRIEAVDVLLTASEKEALLLESSLIKKHRPRYNVVLKDDKNYILFKLDKRSDFPRLAFTRRVERDGATYFGPFTSAAAARTTWKELGRVFPLRKCGDRTLHNRVRPCLYYFIGQCLAPCVLPVEPQEYMTLVRRVEAFLTGRSAEILRAVQKEMEEAAERLAFEQAAKLRDLLKAMRRTVEGQATVLTRLVDMDVVNMAATEHGVGLCVLFVRQGRLLDRKTFFFPGVEAAEADAVAVTALVQFYRPGSFIAPRVVVPATLAPVAIGASGPPDPVRPGEAGRPDPTGETDARGGDPGASDVGGGEGQREGASPGEAAEDAAAYGVGGESGGAGQSPEAADAAGAVMGEGSEEGGGDGQALAEILAERRGAGVRLGPPRGREERQLLEMAAVNARRAAEEAAKAAEGDILPSLARKFGLPALSRIEAVDVSHLGGKGVRVGMVVFEDGTPQKSDYRAYAFPELEGTSDDYLALATFAAKRAASGPPWPDLLLIDGGKGQLEAVSRSLTEAGVAGAFALASIAKGERRSQNEMDDVIYVPGRKNPLSLRSGSPELLFLQRVRDTVHDFSIGRQRRARNTASLQSTVLELPGVGPKTARLLWEAFGSVTAMRAAGAGEIMAKTGLGPRRAAAVAAALAALAD
ncbi:excinuclease ABC, C subunit [Solidesulfovibrio carbinoliphilus subsp. oakridgensis]|uniref:UvrABC system protein C n=1 Tax=Solidesulfovibrio carbinoliphilus subsp. oakridgensis TaxID=694327 RepID=G7Q5T0_9BACT|nr:excinuclease ABC subunit UvrC [Solidesulfovibrio carbinoliphilus]EHJ46867.1 excinuclease ABC, C subunit [Solidesulfovibrio carbinoliphilus subsp. oakridgensis]